MFWQSRQAPRRALCSSLVRQILDDAGIADAALKERKLAETVAEHKSWFFSEKTPPARQSTITRQLAAR